MIARRVIAVGIAAAAALAVACITPTAEDRARGRPGRPDGLAPKVLIVVIEGLIPDAIAPAETPALDYLIERGAFSKAARAESTTCGGAGWSSLLTGVHWDKHGVPDDRFERPRYAAYPPVFVLLRRAFADARTASATSWRPIDDRLIGPFPPTYRFFHDLDDHDDDLFDADSADALCVRDLAECLAKTEVDLAVVGLGELERVGLSHDAEHFDARDPLYRSALERADGHLATLIEAVETRPGREAERWLYIVTSDHAGSRSIGAGRNVPEHRLVPFIVAGDGAARGAIFPAPQSVDVVPTALAHLGVEIDSAWGLDGQAVGLSASRPPPPALGVNLIFNGGAEYERGFAHYTGAPDAWAAGWFDPGAMTVVQYGSGDGFPEPTGPVPDYPGESFFAGGALEADSFMRQRVDLSPLAAQIDAGCNYELAAWLGGYGSQGDHARLTATFRDAAGRPTEVARAGPILATDRGNRTGFRHARAGGRVPPGTRAVEVRLDAIAVTGSNDGYADGLSLILEKIDRSE